MNVTLHTERKSSNLQMKRTQKKKTSSRREVHAKNTEPRPKVVTNKQGRLKTEDYKTLLIVRVK